MMNLKKIALLAALAGCPVAGQADEDWTGFYGGLHFGSTELSGTANSDTTAFLGVHAGYDYDFGNYIIGGELAYDGGATYTLGGGVIKTDTVRIKLKGGYDLGRTMVYGVVGYSSMDAFSADGASYGLGATYKITDSITIGAEYLHDSFSGSAGDFDADSIALRASYRF